MASSRPPALAPSTRARRATQCAELFRALSAERQQLALRDLWSLLPDRRRTSPALAPLNPLSSRLRGRTKTP